MYDILYERTSDGGNGSNNVELPQILIKINVGQMFLFLYACLLVVHSL